MSVSPVSQDAWAKLSNTDNLFEGFFWGSFCAHYVVEWNGARREKNRIDSLSEAPDKSLKVWEAQKKYILSCLSLISGISMVTTWLEGLEIINLASAGVAICSLGYGGSGIVSTVKAYDALKEFDQGISHFNLSKCDLERGNIALDQLEKVLKIAFLVSLAFWGIFGALYTSIGGGALCNAVDASLYYSLVLFISNIAGSMILPIFKKKV